MKFSDMQDMNVTKIVGAKKLCQSRGFNIHVSEYRGNDYGLSKGFFTMGIVLEGEAKYCYKNKIVHAKKGDVFFLNNYEPFNQFTVGDDYYTYIINFVSDDELNIESTGFQTRNVQKYHMLFKEVAIAFSMKEDNYLYKVVGNLYKILALAVSDNIYQNKNNSKYKKVESAIRYIYENLSDSHLTVKNIADTLDISTTYLVRIFKEVTGSSPLEYIKSVRINYASDMLITQNSTVEKVAFESGFYDSSYFCKEFKKVMGCSPRSFKKNHRTLRVD